MAISKDIKLLTDSFVNKYISADSHIPVKIEGIVKKESILIEERKLDDDLSGLLILHGDTKLIGVEKDHVTERKRFTIAHELGHYVLHRNESKMFVDTAIFKRQSDEGGYTTREERMEREANYFAANILMPEILVRREVRQFYKDLNDEANITQLAAKFEVSLPAMTFRLINLGII